MAPLSFSFSKKPYRFRSLLLFLFFLFCLCLSLSLFLAWPHRFSTGRVAIASVMRHPADLPRWLAHHRELGIAQFVLRLEDADEVLLTYLRNQPDVVVKEVQNEFGDQDHYTTLMDRQKAFVNGVLDDAVKRNHGLSASIDWLLFIDDDEFLQGSLAWFSDPPKQYHTVKLQNVEAVLSSSSSSSSSSFEVQGYVRCTGDGKYKCRSYTNGKGGGRVLSGVSLMGPHDFGYHGTLGGDTCYEMPFESLYLLHVESPTFLAWTDKYLRLQGTKDAGACPFPWYHDSVKAVGDAYALYLRTVTQPLPHDDDKGKEQSDKQRVDNYHRFS